jgi:hypothetical protein
MLYVMSILAEIQWFFLYHVITLANIRIVFITSWAQNDVNSGRRASGGVLEFYCATPITETLKLVARKMGIF